MMRRAAYCALSLLIGMWLISAAARAEDYPIVGDWVIDKAIVAPWVGPNADMA